MGSVFIGSSTKSYHYEPTTPKTEFSSPNSIFPKHTGVSTITETQQYAASPYSMTLPSSSFVYPLVALVAPAHGVTSVNSSMIYLMIFLPIEHGTRISSILPSIIRYLHQFDSHQIRPLLQHCQQWYYHHLTLTASVKSSSTISS